MVAAPRERTAAEIVRQAGTATVAEAVRQASTRAPVAPTSAAQPIIRVIDESVKEEETQRVYVEQQKAVAAQSAQLESAMRIAANASRPAAVAGSTMSDAGPLFISPRAEVPQQRTLFSNQEPEFEMADDGVDAEVSQSKSLFNRLANVGKSIAGSGSARPVSPRAAGAAQAPLERKPEVRESAPHAGDEDEFYDIPAFLRRQAN
jgi:hypothetical protein